MQAPADEPKLISGIALDQDGFIEANANCEASMPGLYAVGEVKRGPMTANAALHDAKVAAANAILGNHAKRNYFKGAGGDQLGPGNRRDRPERGAGGIRLSDETPQVGRKQSYKRAE